jgi:hypothetical protein
MIMVSLQQHMVPQLSQYVFPAMTTSAVLLSVGVLWCRQLYVGCISAAHPPLHVGALVCPLNNRARCAAPSVCLPAFISCAQGLQHTVCPLCSTAGLLIGCHQVIEASGVLGGLLGLWQEVC